MAVHIAVDPRNRPPPSAVDLATIFESETVSGSRVFGGAALTWTDFAVHEDGSQQAMSSCLRGAG